MDCSENGKVKFPIQSDFSPEGNFYAKVNFGKNVTVSEIEIFLKTSKLGNDSFTVYYNNDSSLSCKVVSNIFLCLQFKQPQPSRSLRISDQNGKELDFLSIRAKI